MGTLKYLIAKKNISCTTTRGSIQVINTVLQVNSPCESKLIVFHRDYSQNRSYRRSPLSSRYTVGFYTDNIIVLGKKKPYYNVPFIYFVLCYIAITKYIIIGTIYKIISSNC